MKRVVLLATNVDEGRTEARRLRREAEEDIEFIVATPATAGRSLEGAVFDEVWRTDGFASLDVVRLLDAVRRGERKRRPRRQQEVFTAKGLAYGQLWRNRARGDELRVCRRVVPPGGVRVIGDIWLVKRPQSVFRYLTTEHALWERGYRLKEED